MVMVAEFHLSQWKRVRLEVCYLDFHIQRSGTAYPSHMSYLPKVLNLGLLLYLNHMLLSHVGGYPGNFPRGILLWLVTICYKFLVDVPLRLFVCLFVIFVSNTSVFLCSLWGRPAPLLVVTCLLVEEVSWVDCSNQ